MIFENKDNKVQRRNEVIAKQANCEARIAKQEIEYIEKLACIKLSEEERKEIAGQLSKILDYINKLNEIDTKEIELSSLFQKNKQNVFRKDKVEKSLPLEEVLKNTLQREGDFFKVPKIITDKMTN